MAHIAEQPEAERIRGLREQSRIAKLRARAVQPGQTRPPGEPSQPELMAQRIKLSELRKQARIKARFKAEETQAQAERDRFNKLGEEFRAKVGEKADFSDKDRSREKLRTQELAGFKEFQRRKEQSFPTPGAGSRVGSLVAPGVASFAEKVDYIRDGSPLAPRKGSLEDLFIREPLKAVQPVPELFDTTYQSLVKFFETGARPEVKPPTTLQDIRDVHASNWPAYVESGRRYRAYMDAQVGSFEESLVGSADVQIEMERAAESANALEKLAAGVLGLPLLFTDPVALAVIPLVGPVAGPMFKLLKAGRPALANLFGPGVALAVESIGNSSIGVGTFGFIHAYAVGPLSDETGEDFVTRLAETTAMSALFGGVVFGIPLGAFRAARARALDGTVVQSRTLGPPELQPGSAVGRLAEVEVINSVLPERLTLRTIVKITDDLTPLARQWLRDANAAQQGSAVKRGELLGPEVRAAYEKELGGILKESGRTRAEVVRAHEGTEVVPPTERVLTQAEIQKLAAESQIVRDRTELPRKAEERLEELEIVREETPDDVDFLITNLIEKYNPAELVPAFEFWKRTKKNRDLVAGLGEALASRVLTQEAFLRDLTAGSPAAVRAVGRVRRGDSLGEGEVSTTLTFGELRRQLKLQKKASQGLRDEAVRLVKQNVPKAGQADLIRSISRADTVTKLANAISHANRVVERVEKKQAITRFKGVLKRAKRRKLDPKYAKIVKDIDAEFDASNLSENLRASLKSTAEFLESQPEAPVSKKTLERLARLDKTSLKSLDAAEINELTNALRLALRLNRLKGKLVGLQRGRSEVELGSKITSDIELGVPKLKPRHTVLDRARGLPASRPQRRGISLLLLEFSTRPEILTDYLSPGLSNLVWEQHGVQGYRTENKIIWDFRDRFNTLADALGLKTRGIRSPKFEKWRKGLVEVEGVQVTRGEAVMLELLFRNSEARTELKENGYTLFRTDKAHEFTKLNSERLDHAIENEGVALANHLFDGYNGPMKELINGPSVRVFGYEIATRENYVPTVADLTRVPTTGETLQTMSQLIEITVSSWGALKPKEGTKAPLVIKDAFDVYFDHVDHVARYNAYLESSKNALAVLGLEEVKRAIIDRIGRQGLERIKSSIRHQAVRAPVRNTAERVFRQFLRQAGASVLGLRPSTLLLNPAGLPVTAAYIEGGFELLAESLAQPIQPGEWKAMNELMITHAPDMRSRYYDFASTSTAGIVTQRTTFGRPRIAELGLMPLQFSDLIGSFIRWRMSKAVVERQLGIKPEDPRFLEEVASEWTRQTFRGENTSSGIELTGALALGRSNFLAAPFAMFSSSQSKLGSLVPRAYYQARRSEFERKEADKAAVGGDTGAAEALRAKASKGRRLAVGSLAAFVAGTAWVVGVREAIKSAEGRAKDKPLLERLIKRAVSEVISNVPLVGEEVVEPIVRRIITGEKGGFRPGTIAESTLQSIKDIGVQGVGTIEAFLNKELAASGEEVAGKKLLKWLDTVAEVGALFAGFPFGGPKSMIRMAVNVLGPKTPSDRQILLDALKPTNERPDLTQAKRSLLYSLVEENEKSFRRAVLGLPEEERTRKNARSILLARYAGLLRVDRRVELDEEGLAALEHLKAEVRELEVVLDEFIEANPDVMRGGRR